MSKVYGLCVRVSNLFLCKALDFNGFFYWHNHMLTHTHSSTIFGMKEKNQIYSMHSHSKIIKSYLRCFQTIFLQRCVCSFCFRPFAKLFSKYCFFFHKKKWVEFGRAAREKFYANLICIFFLACSPLPRWLCCCLCCASLYGCRSRQPFLVWMVIFCYIFHAPMRTMLRFMIFVPFPR